MPLDKANKDVFYLLGRYVAVVERSNNEFFNSSQMHNIQDNTDNLMRYDHNKLGFADVRQQIMGNLDATGWPKKVLADADGGRFWIGYYHQKAALPMFTDKVERHTPERVTPKDDNEIDELRDRPATSE
ncbi:MAG: hypothetical protein IJM66_11485 [Muribaculaceae bacterium]|nr:hypothetical protein [Muribaculaceae bacterium]MBQ6649454.1 hypothetical protein [Muribaculaceae bacterium]